MGIFSGEDWKTEKVGLGLRWIPPELGDCGCFTCTAFQRPQRMEIAKNPLYKGNKAHGYMAEWGKHEEDFFQYMDRQPVVKCCFGHCDDTVDKKAAVEALNKEWIPTINSKLNGVAMDAFFWSYTGGGAETGRKYDIVIRFLEN